MSDPVGPKIVGIDSSSAISSTQTHDPLSAKMKGLFARYHPQISIPERSFSAMVEVDNKLKAIPGIEAALNQTIDPQNNPETLRAVVERMIVTMRDSGVPEEVIEEFYTSFRDLSALIKTSGGLKKVLDDVDDRLWFVMYINRSIRNLSRALSVVLQSEGIRSFGVSLGVLNLLGALSETKDVIYSAWMVVAPGRTHEQRIGACWDVLKNSAYVIADIGIGLNALSKWVGKIPVIGTLSGISLYVIIAAYLTMLMKSVLDYVMSKEILAMIEKDSKGKLDYGRFKQIYTERINDLNQTNIVLRALIRIAEPDILSVLDTLQGELEKQGVILPPGQEGEGNLLTKEQNMKVKSALRGRITDKMDNFPAIAVSHAVNALAIGMLVLCPPIAALDIVNGNLFVGTSLLWIWNRHVEGKSKARFREAIGKI